ncbi:MAG: 1-acyl-sn-glycerol-3-phosphate acyltransferase, partial [Candidatus Paceibacterota bacterium]
MISQEAIQNMPKKEADFVSIIYFLLRHSVGFFIKRIWVKRVVGIKNIPKDGPAIIVFNHQSYFDFLTFAAVAPRNVHFLSAEKFFEDKWWKPLMKFTGQIRVNRSSSDKEVVHNAVSEHLKKEKIIGIFPEGTRSPHKHMMLPGFTGAAKYALLHKIQIIPVGIRGAYDILPRDKKYPRFRKHIEIHVGKPIHFSEIHHDILTHKIMRELEKLSGRDYPYDMADKEIKKREGIIILDMDNTLLRGQSQEHLIKYLREIGLINSYKALVILGWFILYSLHLTNNTTRITEYVLSNFKNKNFDEIDNIINTFFETKLKKNIYKDGIKLVNDLKKDGRKIILVSAA